MSLAPGARLGAYEIVSLLGAGGMGEVYRARDTKLNRVIAIKVLLAEVAGDPDRLMRFQREAQLLASLNHPHIAAIYGVEDAGPTVALVMELVDGLTLADRLASGPLPIDEALAIARQLAEALEAAHDQGIVHRDLKPANVKVRDDGTVKVLDFGLAKALDSATGLRANATMSPTLSMHATQAGLILGTAAYMAPEQARGRPVDRRADIWAFGVIVFEMLAGRRAFEGDDISITLAAVLKDDVDWSALPSDTPPHLRTLLRRCLQKDPQRRLPHVGLARIEIEEGQSGVLSSSAGGASDSRTALPTPPRPLWKRAAPIVTAAIAASALTGLAMWRWGASAPPSATVARFSIELPEPLIFGSSGLHIPAISPDGTQVAYAALTPDAIGVTGTQRLYVRSLADNAARPLAGTEMDGPVGSVVFSPDGRSLVYYGGTSGVGIYTRAKGALKRVATEGGTAVRLADVDIPFGVSWSGDWILVGQASKGIDRVPAGGGEPERIVSIKSDEIAQGPQLLPGGDAVLFTLARGIAGPVGPRDETWDKADIVVQRLKSGERKTVIRGGSDARYIATGHLVYAVSGTLRAVRFDLRRLEVIGTSVQVLEGVGRTRFGPNTRTGEAHFSVSDNGALAYLPGPSTPSSPLQNLAYVDRARIVESLKLMPARYEFPSISPDGKQVVVGINDGTDANVWIYELSGSSPMRQLTFGGRNQLPVWSADGQYVAFQSDREGDSAIFWQRADGSAPAVRLTKPEQGAAHVPTSWSPKNAVLLFEVHSGSRMVLSALSMADRHVTTLNVQSASIPPSAVFSPNGRWIAYQTGEIPRPRILVQPFPTTGAPFTVADGRHPRWSVDGKRLFYTVTNRVFAVTVDEGATLRVSNPSNTTPFTAGFSMGAMRTNYDVTHDGTRLLGVADETPTATSSARRIQVVLNWQQELKQRVPTR